MFVTLLHVGLCHTNYKIMLLVAKTASLITYLPELYSFKVIQCRILNAKSGEDCLKTNLGLHSHRRILILASIGVFVPVLGRSFIRFIYVYPSICLLSFLYHFQLHSRIAL